MEIPRLRGVIGGPARSPPDDQEYNDDRHEVGSDDDDDDHGGVWIKLAIFIMMKR